MESEFGSDGVELDEGMRCVVELGDDEYKGWVGDLNDLPEPISQVCMRIVHVLKELCCLLV